MSIFERIGNGWNLAMDCFRIIRENKKLLIFPIFSTIALLLILGTFIGGINTGLGINFDNFEKADAITRYSILFIFYFICYAVIIFFNMSLIHSTMKILNGEEESLKDSVIFSLSKIGLILSWALLSATIGIILKMIEDKNEKVASFISGIFGMLWSVATFFVVPVLAYENVGVFQAISRSTSLLKNTWGERIGATFAFSIIGWIISLAICLPLFLLFGAMIGLTACFVILIAVILTVSCVISTAETIFTAAAYHYAVGAPLGSFDKSKLTNIFA